MLLAAIETPPLSGETERRIMIGAYKVAPSLVLAIYVLFAATSRGPSLQTARAMRP
jgi:hypothetical protein